MRGVFLDDRSVTADDLNLDSLRNTLPDWDFAGLTTAGEVADRISNADVVVTNKVVLDRQSLENARHLQLICVAATGTNNIDLETADRLGIPVCNVRGYATASVVEHVFMSVLALGHRLAEHQRAVRAGKWVSAPVFSLLDYPFHELGRKTLGIIGYGELGKAVANVASAFGMKVRIAQRPGGPEQPGRLPLEQLLQQSDVVSLHCPLTPATRNLIGMAELRLMRKHALLINTARGGIVEESALADALRNKLIGGAAIDVLSEEPPGPDNPLLCADIPNLLLTPHIAWAGTHSRQTLIEELAENIRSHLAGIPRNRVTFDH